MQREQPLLLLAQNFFLNEEGASSVEYGLLVALIAVVIMTSVRILGRRTRRIFRLISRNIGS